MAPTKKIFGKSGAGLYRDVVKTIDWSVGQVLKALKKEGIAKNTIVFFASDNGPWQNAPDRMFQKPSTPEGSNWKERWKVHGAGNQPWDVGSAGPLRGYKATTYEVGTRVPAMIRWPGHINPSQVSDALVANLDMYVTFLKVGGDHPVDGHDMMSFFTGQADQSPRQQYGYFLHGDKGY